MRTVVCLIIYSSLLLVPISSHCDIHVLNDTTDVFGASFSQTVDVDDKTLYEIKRIHADGPYYDGLPGNHVLLIRKYHKPAPAGPEDTFTQLVKGHYRLFAFDSETMALYAFDLEQRGAIVIIHSIKMFNNQFPSGKTIGPSGKFQYGSPSPSGRHCLLIDRQGVAIDLLSEEFKPVSIDPSLVGCEADPPRYFNNGWNGGRSARFDGVFLKMNWDSVRSGYLNVRDTTGLVTRTIRISID